MNTILSPHEGERGNGQTSSTGIQESIYLNPHEVNITEGGEFLDDAIRTKDQPLGETRAKEKE